jgi:hypothetical protein
MATGQQTWQLGPSCDEALSDMRERLALRDSWQRRLPDRRGKSPPRLSGEREYGTAAVCRVTNQHGYGGGDLYAFSAIGS